MIIDCISDLHGHYPKLQGGDLLIVAGDLTARDTLECYRKFYQWIEGCNYKKIIIIAGNHDNRLQENGFPPMPDSFNIEYLCDSGTEFEGLRIWGSPWTKTFEDMNPHCKAFTFDTEEELDNKWAMIPDNTDILITHSPSFGNLDYTYYKESAGSIALWMRILSLGKLPKLHVFGHIHEAYDVAEHYNGLIMVNASHVNRRYEPVNKPIRVIL